MSNVEIPPQWESVELQEIAEISSGIQKQQKRRPNKNPHPFLRVANVGRGFLKLEDIHEIELFENDLEKYQLIDGDLLVVEGNGSPDQIGRAATWHGAIPGAVHQNHLIRVRPTKAISSRFLELAWNSPAVSSQLKEVAQSTSGLYTLSTSKVKRIRILLPPLEEQNRIVETLDGHLSLLDTSARELKYVSKKIANLRKSVLLDLVPAEPPESWEVTTTGEAGTVELGRQRHPDWHHGPEMHPYLRVANVFEDRIDTSDVMEMDFSGVFEKYRLEPGDILLNEGQSPHLVGRPALYRGTPPNVAYTNSLLRFRARPDVLPEWALMVFRRHMHARRFMRETRITTNIAHLSSKRLKSVEFPIPPIYEQKRLIQICDELMTNADSMDNAVQRNIRRVKNLRSSLLSCAFNGKLVSQDPSDEPVSALLKRIRTDREAQGGKPRRTTRHSRKAAAPPLPPPSASTPAPTNAVQEELPL